MGDASNSFGHILFDAVLSPEYFDTIFIEIGQKTETVPAK